MLDCAEVKAGTLEGDAMRERVTEEGCRYEY